MVKVAGNADAPILLSNHNVATSDAPQSLIRVAEDSGIKAGSIENLRSELNKLENQLQVLRTDFAAAQTIHTPSPAKAPAGTDTSQPPAVYHYNFRTKSGLIGRDFKSRQLFNKKFQMGNPRNEMRITGHALF